MGHRAGEQPAGSEIPRHPLTDRRQFSILRCGPPLGVGNCMQFDQKRRAFITLLGGAAAAWPLAASAQQQTKIARIGILGLASAAAVAPYVNAVRAGLRDLGYIEGTNLIIEYRFGDGNYDRLPNLAARLVHLNVDVLVTFAAPGTQAAKSATSTIPIVMAVTADAVGTGLIASLAHPGGNVTGTT